MHGTTPCYEALTTPVNVCLKTSNLTGGDAERLSLGHRRRGPIASLGG